jgi:flagellar hook-associated protein 1 FlgK
MGNLLSALGKSSNALRVFERQLSVIQNNVTNANTPGYVRQIQTLIATPFNPDQGIIGGAQLAPMSSSRSDFLEANVQKQSSQHAFFDQKATDLGKLEYTFDLNSTSGVAASFSDFFQSISKLSVNPNDSVARQTVLDQAGSVAASFQQAAAGLNASGADADTQVRDTVAKINDLVGRLRDVNLTRREDSSSKNDAGLEATVYSTLEELASYTTVQTLRQADGTYSVLLAGQVNALVGTTQYRLQPDFSGVQTGIVDASGKDVTSILTGGKLGALLQFKNQGVPSYRADLDRLAETFADQVNGALAAGLDKSGSAPTTNLFSYDPILGAAYTMAVTNITPDQIAAASPNAPGGNGNALQIARLDSQPLIDGFTLTQYYGNLSGRVGRDLAGARDTASTQQNLLSQAQTLRGDATAVSLDDEAAQLIQVQRSYQAASKLIGVLQDLTQTMIDIMR